LAGNLSSRDELILLAVAAARGEAYGVSVAAAILKHAGEDIPLASIHTALYRLEENGLLTSRMGGATEQRGGRSKRLYSITGSGSSVLADLKRARDSLRAPSTDTSTAGVTVSQ